MKNLRTSFRLLPLPAILAAALAAPAHAQSLLDLYESARSYDAAWQSAKAQYDANLYRAEQAKAGILPTANLSAGVTRSKLDNTVPDFELSSTTQVGTVSAVQPLYRPANFATYQQGKRQAELAQAQLTAASQDLIVRVAQAYFDVLAAQDTLTFVRAQKAATNEQLASAKRNFEVGTSTITDTREAQARFDLVVAQEIAAENDLVTKRIALDQLVGRANVVPRQLALPVVLPQVLEPNDPDAWVRQAELQHTAIRRAQVALDVARLETEKARAAAYPTVDAVASVGTGPAGGAFNGAIAYNNAATIGLQLNLPLYSGGSIQNRIRETL